MKLYELAWGLYPRRIGIYLGEKGITGIERIAFDALAAWPAPEMKRLSPMGTVPILDVGNGTLIRSSVAILEYLEERFPSPDLLGATPEARARTRELVSVIDEATTYFGVWCRQASPLFAGHGPQNRDAATMGADVYHVRLRQLDALIGETAGPFLAGRHVTIADCIAMSTLQFAEHCYGVPVPNYGRLTSWYTYFGARPSATLPAYPQPVLALAYGLPSVCPPTSI